MTARDAARVEDLARPHPSTALALSLDVTHYARRREVVRAAQERFGTSAGTRSTPVGAGHSLGSKAALEALTASPRKEAAPLGIAVLAVEPGAGTRPGLLPDR